MRKLVLALLLLCLTASAQAAPEVYVRNRKVDRPVFQDGECYVPAPDLARYFTGEERQRIQIEEGSNRVLVDGAEAGLLLAAGADRLVPLVSVARALGFEVRRNRELNLLDLVPPQKKVASQQTPTVGREYALARRRMEILLGRKGTVTDSALQARVDKIGKAIVAVCERPWVEWHFYVLRDSTPNAMCTGEGFVCVTDSLLAVKLSDAELAGILAHEVAHGIKRHVFALDDLMQKYEDVKADIARFEKEWAARPRVPNPSPAWLEAERQRYSDKMNEFLARLQDIRRQLEDADVYQRFEEEEADMLGMRYATLAGFEPTGLMTALAKLDGKVSTFGVAYRGGDASTSGRSHPPTSRRIAILKSVLASWKSHR
ncbi:MAG TPA: M48 family metalloprotease [Candidatus Nitrosotenuis sp.]|nr:M48 family metalloprotease [Candidatus Nitrosotenuis sp.]